MCHIHALAGVAGINSALKSAYDYGVDGTFYPVIVRGNERVQSGLSLDFQAKATINWTVADDEIVYDLDARAYNNIVLRPPEETMLILILLCLPREPEAWHGASADETVLRHCCYWHIFSDEPTQNSGTKRIRIPTQNLLTPASLLTLLDLERRAQKRAFMTPPFLLGGDREPALVPHDSLRRYLLSHGWRPSMVSSGGAPLPEAESYEAALFRARQPEVRSLEILS